MDYMRNGRVLCPVCEGTNKVYIEPRDCIEGNKGRRTGFCDFCYEGTIASNGPIGLALIAFWEKLNEISRQKDLIDSAKAKLSIEEKEALGLL